MQTAVEDFKDVVVPYAPHNGGQQLFHASQARFRVLACGTRWGKERCCVPETINRIAAQAQEADRPGRNLVPNIHWWATAPTYALTKQLWMELKFFTPKDLIEKINETEKYMLWKKCYGGALIEMKSAHHPDELVSVGLDGVLITEAGLIKIMTWKDSIRPRLASRRGICIANGTPRGKWERRQDGIKSLLYDMYLKGQDPEETEWESWKFPTWTNPYIVPDEIESIRRDINDPKLFAQNIGAEFIDFAIGKAVFRNTWKDEQIKPAYAEWKNNLIVIRGWDKGFHHPACIWNYINTDDQLCVAKEFMGVDMERDKFLLECARLSAAWFPEATFIDYVPADFVQVGDDGKNWKQVMAHFGIHAKTGAAGKDEVIRRTEAVRKRMRLREDGKFGMIVDPSCEIFIEGCQGAYHYPEVIDKPEDEKPYKDGFYDHLQDGEAVICDNHFNVIGQKSHLKTIRAGRRVA